MTIKQLLEDMERDERRRQFWRCVIFTAVTCAIVGIIAMLAHGQGGYRQSDPVIIPQAGDQNPPIYLQDAEWWFQLWLALQWMIWP